MLETLYNVEESGFQNFTVLSADPVKNIPSFLHPIEQILLTD